MQEAENAATAVGRLLMCLLFVLGGWGKLLGAAATQALFAKLNLPMPEAAWLIAVVVELGGGLLILFGLFTRPVALILAVWCVVTALIAHTNFADRGQEINFFKNMAMAGGFLYVTAFGAGRWSLDGWRSSRRIAMAAE
jgi:putative oxidoreductase